MKIQLASITALIVITAASSAWAGAGCCGAAQTMASEPAAVAPAAKAQTMCPVLDEPIKNKEVYVDYNGLRVYLCCAGCKATFEKDPDKYMKKFESDGVLLDKTPAQE